MVPLQKQQFHCTACGICRVGGADNFFHCATCGCCYARSLQARTGPAQRFLSAMWAACEQSSEPFSAKKLPACMLLN